MKDVGISILVIVILALTLEPPVQAQKKEKKEEAYRQMTALLESGSYEFRVQSVNPAGGRSINPSSIYTMTVTEGVFKAYLPYFGRAYQASYGGDGGIEFEGNPEKLEITRNEKKRSIFVKFEIDGKNDRYKVTLSAGAGEYGTLSINCQKRQPISYYGPITPMQKP